MTPLTARILAYVLTGLMLVIGVKAWLHQRDVNRDNAAVAAQVPKDAAATSGVVDDASVARADADQQVSTVSEARITYHHVYEEAKRNDQTIATWADTPVPERLRDLAAERALQRQRAGSDASGRGGDGDRKETRR